MLKLPQTTLNQIFLADFWGNFRTSLLSMGSSEAQASTDHIFFVSGLSWIVA